MARRANPKNELVAAKERRQDAFLAAFSELGTIAAAAKASKMNRRNHFKWLEKDENYRKNFAEAQAIAGDKLEEVARKRATEGWLEPVFYEGEVVGHKPKYSDTLMAKLLDGALPEKYKQRYEKTGSGEFEKSVNFNFDLTSLSDEELRGLNNAIEKIGG